MIHCAYCRQPIHEPPVSTPAGWMHQACAFPPRAGYLPSSSYLKYRLAMAGVALVAFSLMAGGYAFYRIELLPGPGAPCKDKNDCAGVFDAACLEDNTGVYCSRECSSAKDCPKHWTCEPASIFGPFGPKKDVCARPGSKAPE